MERCTQIHSFCGRLCSQGKVVFLMTKLGLIEGDILETLDKRGLTSLHLLMEILAWEPCAIAMAVGVLIRQNLVQSFEAGEEVFLKVAA